MKSNTNSILALLYTDLKLFLTIPYFIVLILFSAISYFIPFSHCFIQLFLCFIIIFFFKSDIFRKCLSATPFMPYKPSEVVTEKYLFALISYLLFSIPSLIANFICVCKYIAYSGNRELLSSFIFLTAASIPVALIFFALSLPLNILHRLNLGNMNGFEFIDFLAGSAVFSLEIWLCVMQFIDPPIALIIALIIFPVSLILVVISYIITRKKYPRTDILN